MRAARIGTNIPELLGLSKWVYETNNSNDRIINPTLSPLLQEVNMSSLSLSEKVSHAWDLFYCSVTQVIAKQRTTDWFLARMFSFTSTSLYKVISENATRSYITEDIVSDFLATQQVMSLNVQDESANSLSQQEATSRRGDRTSITYWINNKSKPQLMQLLNEKGIDCTEQMNKRQLAELLVAHINENANTSSKGAFTVNDKPNAYKIEEATKVTIGPDDATSKRSSLFFGKLRRGVIDPKVPICSDGIGIGKPILTFLNLAITKCPISWRN